MRFVMVDRILKLEPGVRIEASKTFDPAEELFLDHFPGFPVVPGVLLTEMMAQAGGKCLYSESPRRGYPVLVRIRDASFRSWVEPGKEIRVHAEVATSAAAYASVKCHATVDGKKICNAELSFAFTPTETFGAENGSPAIFSLESNEDQTDGE